MGTITILGARGQLGAELSRLLASENPALLDRATLDVTDETAVSQRIRELRPSIVVNATAYNKVDLAEDDPNAAWRVNALAPRSLARACDAAGALLVHFSTDYVFGAPPVERAPRSESDAPSPVGVYAVTKLAGEHFALAARRSIVIRTCGLYGLLGAGGKGTNFVETILRVAESGDPLRVVDDQILSPTSAADLAATVVALLSRWRADPRPDLLGLYHATNAGACSWFEFARAILQEAGVETSLVPISTADYGARAPRPAYSVLAGGHLERIGLPPLRPWRSALVDYLTERTSRPRRP